MLGFTIQPTKIRSGAKYMLVSNFYK